MHALDLKFLHKLDKEDLYNFVINYVYKKSHLANAIHQVTESVQNNLHDGIMEQ